MIRYYICPVVDDGLHDLEARGYGMHPKIFDLLPHEPGASTVSPGVHPDGWTLCVVNRTDHSPLDAAPDVEDVLQGALDVTLTKSAALQAMKQQIPAAKRPAIDAILNARGIDTSGLTTGREILDRVLRAIDPAANLRSLGVE